MIRAFAEWALDNPQVEIMFLGRRASLSRRLRYWLQLTRVVTGSAPSWPESHISPLGFTGSSFFEQLAGVGLQERLGGMAARDIDQ